MTVNKFTKEEMDDLGQTIKILKLELNDSVMSLIWNEDEQLLTVYTVKETIVSPILKKCSNVLELENSVLTFIDANFKYTIQQSRYILLGFDQYIKTLEFIKKIKLHGRNNFSNNRITRPDYTEI